MSEFMDIAKKFEDEKVEYISMVKKINAYFDENKEQFYKKMHGDSPPNNKCKG